MAQRHELPTHLSVEDRVLGGCSMRQLLVLLSGLAGTYALWFQLPAWPLALRALLAAAGLLATMAVALVRPGGRNLAAWTLALLRYAALPKRSVWRPQILENRLDGDAEEHWVPLTPRLAWAGQVTHTTAGGRP